MQKCGSKRSLAKWEVQKIRNLSWENYVIKTKKTNKQTNSVAWARKQTIPTEWKPLVGEVSANFCGLMGATWSAWRIPTAIISDYVIKTAKYIQASEQSMWGYRRRNNICCRLVRLRKAIGESVNELHYGSVIIDKMEYNWVNIFKNIWWSTQFREYKWGATWKK
jgi:hypothetical protein